MSQNDAEMLSLDSLWKKNFYTVVENAVSTLPLVDSSRQCYAQVHSSYRSQHVLTEQSKGTQFSLFMPNVTLLWWAMFVSELPAGLVEVIQPSFQFNFFSCLILPPPLLLLSVNPISCTLNFISAFASWKCL